MRINGCWIVLAACVWAGAAWAQIEKPSESELDAAPSQFQNLLHGRSDKITQPGPQAPKPGAGGGPPGMMMAVPAKNPSHDPHDLTGYWAGGSGPGLPGGGPSGGAARIFPPGIKGHTVIDANRLCSVNLGVQMSSARIYQDKTKITMVFGNELRARRIYFADQHTPGAPVTYNGDSIAHWDGNTLTVDTVALKGLISATDSDLEHGAHTLLLATPALHVVERITKSADGSTLTDHAIWNDPSVSPKPYDTTSTLRYSVDPLGYDSECEDVGDMFGPNYGSAK